MRKLIIFGLFILGMSLSYAIGLPGGKERETEFSTQPNQTTSIPPDTTLQISVNKGEYIIVYDKATRTKILDMPFIRDSAGTAEVDSFYIRIARSLYLDNLYKIDPNAQIFGATAASCFVRMRSDIGFAMQLKNKSRLKNSKGIRTLQDNFNIRIQLPTIRTRDLNTSEIIPWGVVQVSQVPKPSRTYPAAWVLDTGIDLFHPDLNVDRQHSRSFVAGERVDDFSGHGTHVSGIIGAKYNGRGVAGVAPNTPIRALKVISMRNDIKISELQSALNYVLVYSRPGEVVNLSFVSSFGLANDAGLISAIAEKGVYVTIAAGNKSNMFSGLPENIDTYLGGVFPASINGRNIYTVGAFDQTLVAASFECYGNSVDYSQPGVAILSCLPGGLYGEMDGTSMASPHLAGLLLLTNGNVKTAGSVQCPHNGNLLPIAHE